MSERKSVTIHYRKFQRPENVEQTLESLLRKALNTVDANFGSGVKLKDRYISRLQVVDADNLFINLCKDEDDSQSYVMGDILHFTKGRLQALFETANEDAAAVPVQQMTAPAQSEYVHSQMFWFVKNDHVFIIQSISLRTEHLESYFAWLLSGKSQVLPESTAIVLASKFDTSVVGRDLDDIQKIVIGGVASKAVIDPASNSSASNIIEREREVTRESSLDTLRTSGWSNARAVLAQVLGGEASVDRILESVPKDAELSVQVHIGFTTKKKKIDRVALKNLETGLRNLPDGQLEVFAKGNRISSDGTLRLSYPASIRLFKSQVGESQIIGSLLDTTDVERALKEAYDHFYNNGKFDI